MLKLKSLRPGDPFNHYIKILSVGVVAKDILCVFMYLVDIG